MRVSYGRAPLRIGLAGGGTDVPPYSELFGSQVLNVAIDKFATTRVADSRNGTSFSALDLGVQVQDTPQAVDLLPLHAAAYTRFMQEYNDGQRIPVHVETRTDVPLSSGLGGSSALVVSIVVALARHLKIRLSPRQVAELSWRIERIDCELGGGWQDHYASAFGGFNFLASVPGGPVQVETVLVDEDFTRQFDDAVLLYFSGTSHTSDRQVMKQAKQIEAGDSAVLEAMHVIRRQAAPMREALERGSLSDVAAIIRAGWDAKSQVLRTTFDPHTLRALDISNSHEMLAAKMCGAGSKRFLMVMLPPQVRSAVAAQLRDVCGGLVTSCHVQRAGATSWDQDSDERER